MKTTDKTIPCQAAIEDGWHPAMCACVAARMKALESVARAAEWNRDCSLNPHRGDPRASFARLSRALARLERASNPKKET